MPVLVHLTDVEYQGTYVLLGRRRPPPRPWIVSVLPESTFAQPVPYTTGQRVHLSRWPDAAHSLRPESFQPP
jgi:hypothetical protein